tara:strand:- start:287 stop:451 length:165 start_codon:yes stop_codon:yes gene_type:complete
MKCLEEVDVKWKAAKAAALRDISSSEKNYVFIEQKVIKYCQFANKVIHFDRMAV